MKVTRLSIPDVMVLEPKVFGDARGFFFESYNGRAFKEATGLDPIFVQDNHSRSVKGVLRGLHYQVHQPQGKLVRAIAGEIFDVAVDVRKASPTYGRWVGESLSAENRKEMWIPVGFAHGFLVTSDAAEVLYKTTDYWAPAFERTLLWNDATLAIHWPSNTAPVLSAKDQLGTVLQEAELFP